MSIQFFGGRTFIAIGLMMTFSFQICAAEADLALQARQVLKVHCYGCHGQEGSVEGGMNYILDLPKLVSRKKVIPGDPGKSRLYKRLTSRNDPMPPPGVKVRPSKDDVEVIRQWISAGSPDVKIATAKRELVTDADLLRCMHADLQDIDPESRPFTRYFTLAHLYNANLSEDELQTYRHGISKLVNSLSWSSDIKIPVPVDPARTLFRIDLRDYKWDAAIWKGILDQYTYGILYGTATARAIRAATGCELPYVRADWFVFAASRPPLYHDILQLPKTDKGLEEMLQVDVEGNLKAETVARAAFNGSGVSRNNRLIERHPSRYGAYWKSYDFATNTGRQNLFEHPLGPARDETAFQQDGGEIIFHLPNRLQAYMLVDSKGNRINEGPTKIVSVKNKPDPTVINGVSCMACHARGLIEKADQIRAHVDKNPTAFSNEDSTTIKALYPHEAHFRSLVQMDVQRFCRAVVATGVRPGDTEPVAALADRFEAELDLAMAVAEAGLSSEHLFQGVDHVAALAKRLGPLKVEGGTVQRTVFVEAFDDLIGAFRMGSSLKMLNRALADANETILANPKIAAPYCDRADIRLDKGEFDLAVADYTHAIKLEPNTFRAYFHRALAFAAKGDFDKALDDYDRAIHLEPGNADVYHNRALAHASQERFNSALADLTEAIRLDKTNAAMVSDRGLIHVKRGAYDQGITDYDMALKINPRLASVYERRGDAYGLKGNTDKALADYDEALRLNPKWPSVLHHRAAIQYKLKAFGKANDDYREALLFDPRNVQVLNDLAWLQATCPDERIRNGRKAVDHAAMACMKTSSSDAVMLVTLAAAHAECGDYAEAVRLTRKALDLAPKAQERKLNGYVELFKSNKPIRNE